MADIEVTVVARFRAGYEPEEAEWLTIVEDQWMGELLAVEDEEV